MTSHSVGNHLEFTEWPALRDQLLEDASDGLVWRGMTNAEWPIHTSLDRFARANHLRDRGRLTSTLLHQYKILSNELGLEGVDQHSDDQLWALGQHWGLPTPLLDWSRSPLVAAYFAITGSDPSTTPDHRISCIYRLNFDADEFDAGDVRRVQPSQGPWNARLRAQQGVFTVSSDGTCLVKKLEALGYDGHLFAYTFPFELAQSMFADLDAMTINDLRMFPDHLGVIRQARTSTLRILEGK